MTSVSLEEGREGVVADVKGNMEGICLFCVLSLETHVAYIMRSLDLY